MSKIVSYITISELARLINLSRPTLYRYIDAYEKKEYDSIPQKYISLFDDISREEIKSKNQIYDCCMRFFDTKSNRDLLDRTKVLLDNNSSFNELLEYIVNNSECINDVLIYIKKEGK